AGALISVRADQATGAAHSVDPTLRDRARQQPACLARGHSWFVVDDAPAPGVVRCRLVDWIDCARLASHDRIARAGAVASALPDLQSGPTAVGYLRPAQVAWLPIARRH